MRERLVWQSFSRPPRRRGSSRWRSGAREVSFEDRPAAERSRRPSRSCPRFRAEAIIGEVEVRRAFVDGCPRGGRPGARGVAGIPRAPRLRGGPRGRRRGHRRGRRRQGRPAEGRAVPAGADMQLELGAQGQSAGLQRAPHRGPRPRPSSQFDVDYPEDYPGKQLAGKKRSPSRSRSTRSSAASCPISTTSSPRIWANSPGLGELRTKVAGRISQARKAHEADGKLRQALTRQGAAREPDRACPRRWFEREIRFRLEDFVRRADACRGSIRRKAEIDWKQNAQAAGRAGAEGGPRDGSSSTRWPRRNRDRGRSRADRWSASRPRGPAHRARRVDREAPRPSEQARGMEALKSQLLREKSLDYLTSVANIQNEE